MLTLHQSNVVTCTPCGSLLTFAHVIFLSDERVTIQCGTCGRTLSATNDGYEHFGRIVSRLKQGAGIIPVLPYTAADWPPVRNPAIDHEVNRMALAMRNIHTVAQFETRCRTDKYGRRDDA